MHQLKSQAIVAQFHSFENLFHGSSANSTCSCRDLMLNSQYASSGRTSQNAPFAITDQPTPKQQKGMETRVMAADGSHFWINYLYAIEFTNAKQNWNT